MSEQSEHICQVFHFDLYGTREEKYEYLRSHGLHDVEWQQLNPQAPSFFFVPKDFSLQEEYNKGFKIDELFSIGSMGIASGDDEHLVSIDKNAIYNNIILSDNFYYHPFDIRYTKFDNKLLQRARYKLMSNYINHNNTGINVVRQSKGKGVEVLVTNIISNRDLVTNHTFNFPLYLYPEEGSIETERRVNMDAEIMERIMLGTRSSSPAPTENMRTGTSALQVFDYIYGVLHSPTYREKFKEFLKVDFPRIPYPKDAQEFEHYRYYGEQLRELHLLHNIPKSDVSFPQAGSMMVEKITFSQSVGAEFDSGRVFINDIQYFANVPRTAWDMYIGGYQPAQKWLKDRKDRTLTFDDITHYCNIIAVLQQTYNIMKEIDQR